MPVKALTRAVAIVMPAEGPSLGMPPAGTWMCSVFFSKVSRLMPELRRVGTDPRQARSRGLAHDLAQLAGQDEVFLAFHERDFDGDDVPADFGHDQAGRRADLVLGLQLSVLEALRAQVLGQSLDSR